MTDDPGFTPEEAAELNDVVAGAFLGGLIPGTFRFSRAILGAGYRRVAALTDLFEPPAPTGKRIHYFVVGASTIREGRFGWQCSCTKTARYAYGDLIVAFGNALAHVPADEQWRAKGDGQ